MLNAGSAALSDESGSNLDPFRAWTLMMTGEKPGGHGERCVAVGTLDMALWDAAAKIAGMPLYRHLAHWTGRTANAMAPLSVYASGGYYYPRDDIARLSDEVSELRELCDPLDFETLAAVSSSYPGAIAAGEALFSAAEAKLLDRHGGLRRDRDILLFDPVHCYGIPGYLQIIEHLEGRGWPRTAFWPHGGHLFCLHVVAALGLGGAEVNPLCFQPFGGYADGMTVRGSVTTPPETPGIGFEAKDELRDLFGRLHDS